MTSKVLRSGKHALTVRVDEDMYAELREVAAVMNLSVQEVIVSVVKDFLVDQRIRK